jgi:uncharacterized membrane protein
MNKPSRSAVQEHLVHRRHFDRLVMLSDGVFAIAITLSALEIKPELQPGQSLWEAWRVPLMIYFLCFFLIGQLWVFHRRMVAQMHQLDGPATAINLLLLSLVALMPVAIRISLTDQTPLGQTFIYALAVAINYACMALFWGYVAFVAKLVPDMDKRVAYIWLWQKFMVIAAFVGLICYTMHWLGGTVVCGVAFVVIRALIWRWQRALKAAG